MSEPLKGLVKGALALYGAVLCVCFEFVPATLCAAALLGYCGLMFKPVAAYVYNDIRRGFRADDATDGRGDPGGGAA